MARRVRTAPVPPEPEDSNAPVATPAAIARRQTAGTTAMRPSRRRSGDSATIPPGELSASAGSTATKNEPVSESRPSATSGEPSSTSSRRWRKPSNVRGLAGQINEVATLVLNGEINMDTARTYATLARTVAQAMSLEVTRSRFLKEMPDLSIEEDEL